MSFTFQNPFAYFNNPANSKPVGLGNLYVGLPDTDPMDMENPASQIPVYAVQPNGTQLAIPQPIRMTAGGVLTYGGVPIQVRTDADTYAIKTTSSTGAQLYYAARVQAPDSGVRSGLADGTIMIDGQPASTLSYDVLKYGAVGNDPLKADETTAAFNSASDESRYVTANNAVYYINDTINIKSSRQLDLNGVTLIAQGMSGKPLFRFDLSSPTAASEQLTINMGGGLIAGDATWVFEFVGVDTNPTTEESARIIKINGVSVSSSTTRFMKLTNAVKSIFISNVWHVGGRFSETNGKVVETHIENSLIFGNGIDNDGFLMESSGGPTQYSEGLHVTNCTIDNYPNCFNLRDYFVFTLSNSYVGGSNAILFRAPVTTHNREHKIGSSVVWAGRIVYADAGAGVSANDTIEGTFARANAPVIEIGSGWSNIAINNVKATSNEGAVGVAVLVKNGCNDISLNNFSCDETFNGGVSFVGASGSNCRAIDVNAKLGRSVTSERPVITKNPALDGVNDIDLSRYAARLPAAVSVPVGGSFGSVTATLAKGQTGRIIITARIAGAVAGHVLLVDGLSDLSIPEGTSPNWSSALVEIPAGESAVFIDVPFIAKVDLPSVTIGLTNNLGGTLSQNSAQAFIAVIKDL